MSYEQLIRNWHAKASEEDYFVKFMFEYLAFIAYVKNKLYVGDSKHDRPAIQALKIPNDFRDEYLRTITTDADLRNAWTKLKEELERVPLMDTSQGGDVEEIKWWNCSHDNSNQMTLQERTKTKGVIHSLEDWENMVEFWYSVRNNLFHGTKDPEIKRNKLLVTCGYQTLKKLVSLFIKKMQ